MAHGENDRDLRRILMLVGFVLGLVWFAVMFGILSYLHFREIRLAKKKLQEEKNRVAKISSALICPASPTPSSSKPRITFNKTDEPHSKRPLSKILRKGESSSTLQVPPTTQMQQRRGTLPVGASWSYTREQIATMDVTVTGWRALIQKKTKAPSTQDKTATVVAETALSR